MGVQVKCALCAESTSIAGGTSVQGAGWLQVTVAGKRGTRYLCICPGHKDAEAVAAVKAAIGDKR